MSHEEDVYSILREKALLRKPAVSQNPSDYLVAVASHLKTLDTYQHTDFTWIKCRSKHTVAKIRSVYANKTQTDVDICLGATRYSPAALISQLDRAADRIIVLQAVAVNPASPATREPLKPSNVLGSLSKTNEPPTDARKSWPADGSQYHPLRSASSDDTPHLARPAEARNGYDDVAAPPTHRFHAFNPEPKRMLPYFGLTSQQQSPVSVKVETNPGGGEIALLSPVLPAQSSVPQAPSFQTPTAARNERLKKLLANSSLENLEAEVRQDISLLEKFRIPLTEMAGQSVEAAQWLQQIENVMGRNVNEPTIIGVVGNTGAGKSSVINAMLDEERLVPTNCMRACTAVVTELSWNPSDDEDARYRADIEFIKPEDWEKELRVLFSELLDSSGKVSRDSSNEDSEAGIAYAKIKAVYPRLTKEDMPKTNPDELMRHPSVREVLGTTKTIEKSQPDRFYRALQSYVDSKEKLKTGDKKAPKEMAYWPLIKVVKIYIKADALSTGAVVVDLPGVHDSNAARSSIAQNYMKSCTGLWIVAPITRAVDDKAAKSLLGESFKRQLKYDGTYSRVTFICSKTDDISITEASDSLGLDTEMSPKWKRLDENLKERKQLEGKLSDLVDSKAVYGDMLSKADDELETWDKLREEHEDGKIVYAPTNVSNKRKGARSDGQQKKRRKLDFNIDSEDDSNVGGSSDEGSDGSDVETVIESRGEPLNAITIEEKIKELKAVKKDARLQRRQLDENISELRENLKALKATHDEIEAEMSSICIVGRNQYSRAAIQQDFAAGIKELDQENMAEDDEVNFDPDAEIRDYDEVARSLPVFCISSRAYQKLSGRLQRDKDVPGFKSVEETEVPQLQAHCKKLTEAGRTATCHRFLNAVSQLVNSLAFWASCDGTGRTLSDAQIAFGGRFLQKALSDLENDLEKSVQGCLAEMNESLAETIFDRFEQVIDTAVNEANATTEKWGSPVNRENRAAGGYVWSTYKAICRREGVYTNAWGTHDFNSQLTDPILKQLASHWERAFARRLPSVLQSFQRSTTGLLESFHKKVESQALKTGCGLAGLAMLGQQVLAYGAIFRDLTEQMVHVINECQRDANRQFTPVIARHLASAYTYCTEESGPGSYMRMKHHMAEHVNETRNIMFNESTMEVKGHLKQMCFRIEEEMSNKADEVFILMRRDYMTVIMGAHKMQEGSMSEKERLARFEISSIIHETENLTIKEESLEGIKTDEDEIKIEVKTEEDEMNIKKDDGETKSETEAAIAEVEHEDMDSSDAKDGSIKTGPAPQVDSGGTWKDMPVEKSDAEVSER